MSQRLVRLCRDIAILLLLAALPHGAFAADAPTRLLVLDLELIGDVGEDSSGHAARLRLASERLREELARLDRYEIVDTTPAQAHIEALAATQYLHKCNGCELDLAVELGAEQVLVAWVDRISQLILSLTYEIRDVPSGRTLKRKSFDFRGDNDTSWLRAVTVLVRDLAADPPP
jgi:hypothetical protein